MKPSSIIAASKHLLLLPCTLIASIAFGQSHSISLNVGPSMSTHVSGQSGDVVGVSARPTWNGRIEYLKKAGSHLEWGLGLNLLSHSEERQHTDSGAYVETYDIYIPTGQFTFGYRTAMGRNTFGAGITTGICLLLAKDNPGGCMPYGMNGGFYFRYGYVLSERFDLNGTIQAIICPEPSIVSVPATIGVAYKFRGVQRAPRDKSEPAKTTHRKAPPPFPPPLPPLPWRSRSAENAAPGK